MSNWAHEILVENEVDQKRTKLRQFLIHAIPMLNPSEIFSVLYGRGKITAPVYLLQGWVR